MKVVRIATLLASLALLPSLGLAASGSSAASGAPGWVTQISSHTAVPELMIAIDKDSQTFFMFTKKSPLEVSRKLPCTTGSAPGDKMREGDMRTPEGVYFVEEKVPGKLDFGLYGDHAFSLNYPNPIDRLKGKTGHGIWIHGRGKQFVSNDTRGCVALTAQDISALNGHIPFGTPVVIAKKLSWTKDAGSSEQTAHLLAERVRHWASDWQKKSDHFFDYFQPEKFAQTEGVSFSAFKNNKLGIFSRQPWIHVMVDNVRVIQGPDYWVTTFEQYYRTQDLISAVGKRFYWQKDKDGAWRIVGGEYTEASPGLEARYLSTKRADVERLLKGWLEAWLAADVDKYIAYYAEDASNGKQSNAKAMRDYKAALWTAKTPTRIAADKVEVAMHQKGFKVSFVQTYEDSAGQSDKGLKTLVIAPKGDSYVILSETWSKM
ncbi:MAG: L,D-transpeptidase family protein [Humidesulfovibrio sp.]|uniref:L,D-transpeptidase family protein n=1 Tax=Humidesulfovibrio sp. TaxID=2910988 RepID=UPI0027EF0FEC|nr:L,D-transpeptidase family protein [Humidesulfovibrio sp.]MDQ7834764.1 L,D-transpeptidase family protein [Humidesulfovibrio sp.]